jgi:hypothetical protein
MLEPVDLPALANAYALDVLGEAQFADNRDAVDSIKGDFTAGARAVAAVTMEALQEILAALDDQLDPLTDDPNTREFGYTLGRNAEKTSTANHLRYHLQRLKLADIASTPE